MLENTLSRYANKTTPKKETATQQTKKRQRIASVHIKIQSMYSTLVSFNYLYTIHIYMYICILAFTLPGRWGLLACFGAAALRRVASHARAPPVTLMDWKYGKRKTENVTRINARAMRSERRNAREMVQATHKEWNGTGRRQPKSPPRARACSLWGDVRKVTRNAEMRAPKTGGGWNTQKIEWRIGNRKAHYVHRSSMLKRF